MAAGVTLARPRIRAKGAELFSMGWDADLELFEFTAFLLRGQYFVALADAGPLPLISFQLRSPLAD
jgi:hypothetical protein